MAEITIHVQAPPGGEHTGFGAGQIAVEWRPEHAIPTPDAAARIDAQWAALEQQSAAKGLHLFNGTISQLLAVKTQAAADGAAGSSRVSLVLAPGDYKTFLITRMHDRPWFETHAPAAMARALGNSVLLTQGERALLGIRSGKVSGYPHRGHLIGGVLEALGTPQRPASVEGIVSHLLQELAEEAGARERDLAPRGDWPRLLAIAEDHHLGQPEAIWRWQTRTPLEQIAAQLDAAEHTGSLLLKRGKLDDGQREKLTPMARLAWQIWSQSAE